MVQRNTGVNPFCKQCLSYGPNLERITKSICKDVIVTCSQFISSFFFFLVTFLSHSN